MHERPGAVLLPAPKVVVHELPGGEVMGQQTPGTPTAHDIKDAVQDFPFGILLRAPPRFGPGHIRLAERPFAVCQVGRVRFSRFHTPSLAEVTDPRQAF
jgi:hypothetical protein